MPKLRDHTGKLFRRLTVVRRSGTLACKKPVWECVCVCGKTAHVDSGSLVSGNTVSCGCYLQEKITKHGGWKKSAYNTWRAVMRRCYNARDKDYPRYGGRGVTVHTPWHDYAVFAAAVGEPVGGQTLDRKDATGDYLPGNVRWASIREQNRNMRTLKNNTSGHLGVQRTPRGWRAHISALGKSYRAHVRGTLADALADRKALELLHWKES